MKTFKPNNIMPDAQRAVLSNRVTSFHLVNIFCLLVAGGEKKQPVQRKCLFSQLHSLEFIFLEVIVNSTVNLEKILTNCKARGREMTERAKDTSQGVSSLCFLSSLTTFFLGACLLYA